MSLQHLAAELLRDQGKEAPVILALHPGEVATDMSAGEDISWEVEGQMGVEESVSACLKVIGEKGKGGIDEAGKVSGPSHWHEPGAATFWTWDGRRYPW